MERFLYSVICFESWTQKIKHIETDLKLNFYNNAFIDDALDLSYVYDVYLLLSLVLTLMYCALLLILAQSKSWLPVDEIFFFWN